MDGYVTIGWSFFSVKAEVRVSEYYARNRIFWD